MPFPFMAAAALGAAGLSVYGQHKANKANQASAREQMSFQERMSSTAYQRSMEDMRNAGLNPIMAAKFGGASTPSGAASTSQDEYGKASSSAMEVLRGRAEMAKLKADTAVSETTAKYADMMQSEDLFIKRQQWNLLKAQIIATSSSAMESASRVKAINALLPRTQADTKFHTGRGGDISRWLGVFGQGASTALDIKSLLSPKSLNLNMNKYGVFDKSTGEIFNP
jgi:hypothetical protein